MITRSNDMAGRPGSMQSRFVLVTLIAAAGAVYACNATPTTPTSPPDGGTTTPHTPGGSPTSTVKPGVTTLCKLGPGGTFVVSVGVTGANPTTKTVTVDAGQCVDVATVDAASKDDVIVAIVENAVNFAALDHIEIQQGDAGLRSVTSTPSVSFEGSHGAVVTYFNNAIVRLCKVGLTGNFEFQVGLADAFHPLSVSGGQCSTFASIPPASADDVIVTVRENASTSYKLDHLTLSIGGLAARTVTGTTSISFEGGHGAELTFFNVAP